MKASPSHWPRSVSVYGQSDSRGQRRKHCLRHVVTNNSASLNSALSPVHDPSLVFALQSSSNPPMICSDGSSKAIELFTVNELDPQYGLFKVLDLNIPSSFALYPSTQSLTCNQHSTFVGPPASSPRFHPSPCWWREIFQQYSDHSPTPVPPSWRKSSLVCLLPPNYHSQHISTALVIVGEPNEQSARSSDYISSNTSHRLPHLSNSSTADPNALPRFSKQSTRLRQLSNIQP
jgi:hypothetical protein